MLKKQRHCMGFRCMLRKVHPRDESKYQTDKKKKGFTNPSNADIIMTLKAKNRHRKKKKVNNTGRGATEIVRNLNPRISSGPNQNTADGGGCSV